MMCTYTNHAPNARMQVVCLKMHMYFIAQYTPSSIEVERLLNSKQQLYTIQEFYLQLSETRMKHKRERERERETC